MSDWGVLRVGSPAHMCSRHCYDTLGAKICNNPFAPSRLEDFIPEPAISIGKSDEIVTPKLLDLVDQLKIHSESLTYHRKKLKSNQELLEKTQQLINSYEEESQEETDKISVVMKKIIEIKRLLIQELAPIEDSQMTISSEEIGREV